MWRLIEADEICQLIRPFAAEYLGRPSDYARPEDGTPDCTLDASVPEFSTEPGTVVSDANYLQMSLGEPTADGVDTGGYLYPSVEQVAVDPQYCSSEVETVKFDDLGEGGVGVVCSTDGEGYTTEWLYASVPSKDHVVYTVLKRNPRLGGDLTVSTAEELMNAIYEVYLTLEL